MDRATLISILNSLKAEIAAFGVTNLRLFGSYAQDRATASSDIDLIVTFSGAATFDSFMDLKFLLEDRLGRRIDLVTEAALRSEMRSGIEREAIRVA